MNTVRFPAQLQVDQAAVVDVNSVAPRTRAPAAGRWVKYPTSGGVAGSATSTILGPPLHQAQA